MSEITVIALDAMGGDNAPGEMVKGAVDALGREQDIKVYLLGKEDIVNVELQKYTYDKNRLEVVNTTEVIETAEPPVNAIRRKKDSSIVVGMKMVKEGKARCICICRKFRSNSGRRTGNRWKDQRCRASTTCVTDPDREGCSTSDRLWSECRCQSLTSGSVCQDGFISIWNM